MPEKSGTAAKIDRRAIFIRQFLVHQNAARAYREAGYKDGPGTRQSAHRLLTSADIQARIGDARQGLLAALDVTVENVVRRFRDIAFADIASIVGLHIEACRFCYGIDHAYLWRTPLEYHVSRTETRADFDPKNSKKDEVLPRGGYGYDASLPPNQDCPECGGDGIPRIVFKDTRVLTDGERAVFAGVVETRYGVNYRFHDRLAALRELAKRIGFYDPPGNPETNPVARLIEELQSRGQMQRMQLRRGWEQSE